VTRGKAEGRAACELPRWLWLYLPVLSVVVYWLSPLMGYERWRLVMVSEQGLLENATVLFLLPAIVLSVLVFRRRRELPRFVGVWMLLCGLGAFYFGAEELSWGQVWLGLETPEAIHELSVSTKADESFALHNLDWWGRPLLNQAPRLSLTVACLVGGVILPLVLRGRRQRPETVRKPWYWIVPTLPLMPASVLAVFSTVPGKILGLVGRPPAGSYASMAFVESSGELKEYAFALVLMLYVLSVYRRLQGRGGRDLKRDEKSGGYIIKACHGT